MSVVSDKKLIEETEKNFRFGFDIGADSAGLLIKIIEHRGEGEGSNAAPADYWTGLVTGVLSGLYCAAPDLETAEFSIDFARDEAKKTREEYLELEEEERENG